MRLVTRLVGLWILTGAYMKLFHGTPADLPTIARESPLSLSLTFKLIIAAELVIGMLAVFRPSFGWGPALALLLAFISVVGYQVSQDAPSCGCFGTAVQIKPSTMLAIDIALLLLLIVSRPWDQEKNRLQIPSIVAVILAAGLIALPWVFDREATGDVPGQGGWVVFEKGDIGKPLLSTPFGRALPKGAQIQDGLVILYKNSCEVCADHLMALSMTERGDRTVVLLRMPEDPEQTPPAENRVTMKPDAPGIIDLDLPPAPEFAVTPPLHLEIEGGVVTVAREGMEVTDGK